MKEFNIEDLKKKLEEKFNVTINYIKTNNKGNIQDYLVFGGVAAFAISVAAVLVVSGYKVRTTNNNIENSTLKLNSGEVEQEYEYKNVYVVYNADDVFFCNRKVVGVNEVTKTNSQFIRGTGEVKEYQTREEVYGYFDIKTGEKICEDHEQGFYIENLSTVYKMKNSDEFRKAPESKSYDDVSEEIDADYLLSRPASSIRR